MDFGNSNKLKYNEDSYNQLKYEFLTDLYTNQINIIKTHLEEKKLSLNAVYGHLNSIHSEIRELNNKEMILVEVLEQLKNEHKDEFYASED